MYTKQEETLFSVKKQKTKKRLMLV